MTILLIAEHDNETLSDQTAKAMTAAVQIGGDVHVLVAGEGAKGVADQASRLSGASRVLLAEAPELLERLAEPMAALIVSLAEGIRRACRTGDDHGQERDAAGRRIAGRDADIRHRRGGRH